MVKHIIHVNQHNIKANAKHGTNLPVITCKNYKENRYGHEVIIYDKEGNEVAKVVYPGTTLQCGARVWIETHNKVKVINYENS